MSNKHEFLRQQLKVDMTEQEPITYGFETQKEVIDLFEAALTHRNMEILQIIDFLGEQKKPQKIEQYGKDSGLTPIAEHDENDDDLNENKYLNIEECLSSKNSHDLSKLRRLEVRHLTLSSGLCSAIFKGIQTNFVLQELIMTNNCLINCSITTLNQLVEAVKKNR